MDAIVVVFLKTKKPILLEEMQKVREECHGKFYYRFNKNAFISGRPAKILVVEVKNAQFSPLHYWVSPNSATYARLNNQMVNELSKMFKPFKLINYAMPDDMLDTWGKYESMSIQKNVLIWQCY